MLYSITPISSRKAIGAMMAISTTAEPRWRRKRCRVTGTFMVLRP
jgi:hypothetical protein